MGHARLKHLTVKNFRSFVQPSEVSFPEAGLTLFRGFNLDTGGSSGAGKTTLPLAISYLLGFCPFPSTALQSWLTEEPLEVTGTFQVDEGELVVTRGSKFTVTLNGKKQAGSAKQLEDKLTRLVGLAPDLLAALTYRAQKKPGLFLSKTDSEKKEFLTVLLDLGRFEAAVETSQDKAKKLENQVQANQQILDLIRRDVLSYEAAVKPATLQSEDKLKADLEQAQNVLERIRKQVLDLRLKIRSFDVRVEQDAQRMRADAEPRMKALEEAIQVLRNEPLDISKVDQSKLLQRQMDLQQAQGFLQDELTQDQARYKAQRNHADSVYAQLVLIEKKLATKPALEKKLIKLGEQIEQLGRDVCDRCLRTWDQAAVEKAKAEQERQTTHQQILEIEALKPQIETLQAEYKALGNFVPSPVIEELKGIVAGLQAQIAEEKARIDGEVRVIRLNQDRLIAEAQSQLQTARSGLASSIERMRGNAFERSQEDHEVLESLEREQSMAEAGVRGIQGALQRVQIDNARETERAALAQSRLDKAKADLEHAQAKFAETQAELNAELDFQKLIGREGFLGAIFDEVLWEISEETNRLLAQFPNTAHVTLHFRSESTTQKGSIKKAIIPVVSVGGHEAPLSSGLSGGMETAVELAVDLAVAQVVSRRTGAIPGWLILDESFTGLGPVEQEACMEILRAFADDKLVLVVDHSSEFKSLFTQFVDIEYQGGQSRVRS
jgi:DNA repair exonuclease SbcCD ATPase subunit